MNPLVSVVIPTYNVEKYLDKCVRSVIGQSYKNLEIILVDDGSVDASAEMCDDFAEADSRIRVIHKENQGLGMARNTGIECACGEYVCFIDSDDYIDITTVEKCVDKILETGAQAALFGLVNVNENYSVIDNSVNFNLVPLHQSGDDFRANILPELISHDYSKGDAHSYPFSSCTGLFSLSMIRDNNLRFLSERDIISEDSYFLFQLYSVIDAVVLLPEALYYHFVNTSSLTMTYRSDRFERINDFYCRSVELFSKLSFSSELSTRLMMLYHSFTISALKQIVASDLSIKDKRKFVYDIIGDSTFRSTLLNEVICKEKKSIQIFLKTACLKLNYVCYLILILKGK